MDECKLVVDLLPTYCDELTGGETNAFIRSHLNSCPECCRLLEQMQQKQVRQKEMDNQQAEFRAAMAGYQQRHRSRVRFAVGFFLVLIAVFFVLRAFSFDIAIAASGLRLRSVKVVQEPITDDTGEVFQVVFSQTKEDHSVALAYLTKNWLGFWSVDYVDVAAPDKNYGAAAIVWGDFIAANQFGEPHISHVLHAVYAGNNAIGLLDQLPQEEIPGNVAVITTQNSSRYYMHVITVLPNGGSSFDILPLLKEYNLIS